jgi:hypothetical protein
MRAHRWIALLLGAVLTAPPAGGDEKKPENKLPDAVQAVLDKADSIDLLSLDPSDRREKQVNFVQAEFHGWTVLGQTTLKGDDRKAILEAIARGIKESDGSVAPCFIPRHGVRATADGKTVDLVICFQCLQIQAFLGDQRSGGALTTRGPLPAFDKALKDAKVPLPKM